MSGDILQIIKTRLKRECYLMNSEWLRDCVEYYTNQHENPSTEEIFQFVKVQWQLSDLREINNENGSLPPNLSQKQFITLTENYMLQVEQMYDISTPKYKQLEKIRNSHISEVEISETEKLERWEPPKKRMIQLRLTDGLQDVIGIEYNHIPRLNDTLLPGYKVMIIGPVKCHKGVMLLKADNFKGIGGEVDSLLIPNALENILARALNLQENPDPYNDNQTKTNKNKGEEEQIDERLFEDDFDINFEEVSKIEESHNKSNKTDDITSETNIQPGSSTSSTTNAEIKIQNYEQDKIMDDDDYLLEMIDEEQFMEPQIEDKNIPIPHRTLPREDDDDIIIINEEDEFTTPKYDNWRESVQEKQSTSHLSSTLSISKTNSTIVSLHSKMEETQQSLLTGGKRSVSVSPSEKMPLKKGKMDRKITEFTRALPSSKEPKICEFIRDINNERITETTIRTIRGHVKILGKLEKKNLQWTLNAILGDGTGTIEVTFSNKVLENLLGFTVQEFSIKKKLKKNPEIEHQLRMSFRTAEHKVKTMDALLELQLKENEKPTVIKITELTQEQKQLIDRQLKDYLHRNNI